MNKRPLIPQSAGEVTDISVRYHQKWSERFRRAKWFVLIFLFLFAFLMLVFFKTSINYENFLFLLRDLDAEYNAGTDNRGIGVYYDADTEMTCQVFKHHLIVVDTGHIYLYGLSGYRVFTYPHEYRNPCVAISDNYFIVYDLGGYGFTLYNAVGLLYENTSYDYPILDASVADDGTFAILTKNQTYRSSVQVFSRHYEHIGSYHTMRYVTRIDLNEEGTHIRIASVYMDVDSGVPRTVLQAYRIGEKKESFRLEYPNTDITDTALAASSTVPLDVGNIGNNIALLCNNGVLFCTSGGKLDNFFSFSNDLPSGIGKLSTAAYGEGQLALLFLDSVNESKKHLCIINSANGVILKSIVAVDDNITAMSYDENTLFLLSPSHVYKADKNGKLTSIELKEKGEIVGFSAYNTSTAIVSYADKTVGIKFD